MTPLRDKAIDVVRAGMNRASEHDEEVVDVLLAAGMLTDPEEGPAATRVRGVLKDVEHAVAELDRARAAELRAADTYREAFGELAAAEAKVNAVRAILDRAIDGDEPDA